MNLIGSLFAIKSSIFDFTVSQNQTEKWMNGVNHTPHILSGKDGNPTTKAKKTTYLFCL
jgi:hypothetical protein